MYAGDEADQFRFDACTTDRPASTPPTRYSISISPRRGPVLYDYGAGTLASNGAHPGDPYSIPAKVLGSGTVVVVGWRRSPTLVKSSADMVLHSAGPATIWWWISPRFNEQPRNHRNRSAMASLRPAVTEAPFLI